MMPARAAVAAPISRPRIYVAEDVDALGLFMAESELPPQSAPGPGARRAPVLATGVRVRFTRGAITTAIVLAAGLLIGAFGALELTGLTR